MWSRFPCLRGFLVTLGRVVLGFGAFGESMTFIEMMCIASDTLPGSRSSNSKTSKVSAVPKSKAVSPTSAAAVMEARLARAPGVSGSGVSGV